MTQQFSKVIHADNRPPRTSFTRVRWRWLLRFAGVAFTIRRMNQSKAWRSRAPAPAGTTAPSRWAGLCLLAAALVLPAAAASAQEVFRLDDQGWEQVASPEPGTPEAELLTIRKHLAEDDFSRARKLADRWIETHPNHPRLPEAYVLRGDAKTGARDYYKALFDYEYVARSFPASEQFMVALQREFEIARLFAGGVKRKFFGMPLIPAQGEAEELFIRIQERVPGSDLGERASLALANFYFEDSSMNLAAEAYQLFLENYPRSASREWAMLRLIQASLATFQGPRFDPTGLLDAQQRLEQYQAEYPAVADRIGAAALQTRIRESLAMKMLTSADWYRLRGETVSELYTLRRLVREFPQTAAAREAVERIEGMGEPLVPESSRRGDDAEADDDAS